MELTFNKVNDTWVAEFEAAGDFNLHIEKQKGRLYLYQSTVQGGGFDIVESFKPAAEDEVLDFDFTALVYPKYMKVVSFAPVSVGVVTAGEGAEVGYSEAQISETLNTPV